jgi:transposase InsO family protein
VHRVLVRHQLNRLASLDRPTGRPIRRYEHPRPGDLVHLDVKKLGRIPQGGGHRLCGRAAGTVNRRADRSSGGYDYLHAAIDDHSRLAYVELLGDERAQTCARFWRRAHHWFALHGVSVHRVLTDNGVGYRSRLFRAALADTGVRHQRTRPYRPQTNGKVERFNRTLLEEWAYRRLYPSTAAGDRALPPGSTPTTITVPTPRSQACHRSAESTTSPVTTPSPHRALTDPLPPACASMKQGSFPRAGLCCPAPSSGTTTPSDALVAARHFPLVGYRRACFPSPAGSGPPRASPVPTTPL